ncbi:uncharacterized protein GGS25DRAFT_469274 [Hypoxylon fragiforme]|uniref:uncharacterized protein n=1 Tax=Hypoxylon fragiforme TaxID=63214 RepID=UPI0020C651F5|nr:uncharacterized protein GGS25DRAFT_469274 [Hypoxylon fragiforme]KAI2613857.1 hypothetical protein GGS25DRAFT_469274 [Hypoxylon fragiforme]
MGFMHGLLIIPLFNSKVVSFLFLFFFRFILFCRVFKPQFSSSSLLCRYVLTYLDPIRYTYLGLLFVTLSLTPPVSSGFLHFLCLANLMRACVVQEHFPRYLPCRT